MNYKGYEIEPFGNGYTVFYEGDELYFEKEDEVIAFIDGLENNICNPEESSITS